MKLEQLKKEAENSNATEVARKTRREIKNRLGEMQEIIDPRELAENWDEDYKLPRPVVKGDAVIIRGIGEGEVLEVGKEKDIDDYKKYVFPDIKSTKPLIIGNIQSPC